MFLKSETAFTTVTVVGTFLLPRLRFVTNRRLKALPSATFFSLSMSECQFVIRPSSFLAMLAIDVPKYQEA